MIDKTGSERWTMELKEEFDVLKSRFNRADYIPTEEDRERLYRVKPTRAECESCTGCSLHQATEEVSGVATACYDHEWIPREDNSIDDPAYTILFLIACVVGIILLFTL